MPFLLDTIFHHSASKQAGNSSSPEVVLSALNSVESYLIEYWRTSISSIAPSNCTLRITFSPAATLPLVVLSVNVAVYALSAKAKFAGSKVNINISTISIDVTLAS